MLALGPELRGIGIREKEGERAEMWRDGRANRHGGTCRGWGPGTMYYPCESFVRYCGLLWESVQLRIKWVVEEDPDVDNCFWADGPKTDIIVCEQHFWPWSSLYKRHLIVDGLNLIFACNIDQEKSVPHSLFIVPIFLIYRQFSSHKPDIEDLRSNCKTAFGTLALPVLFTGALR